jgi:acyl-CoA thioester hydrolase
MAVFHFYHPIQVRYGDLDTQWHVNNARFLTYMEQARFAYLMELGLFDGESFLDLGLIVADAHIAYTKPIRLTDKVRVGVRVSRIGNKSLTFSYQIEEDETGEVSATGETVLVAYDFHTQSSHPVPDAWRERISTYEGDSQLQATAT